MTETELESLFQRAMSVSLQYGVYSIFSEEGPGQINIRFRREDAMECISFSKYVNAEFKGVDIRAYVRQTDINKIDLTLLVDKTPPFIINAKGLNCNGEGIKLFFKKQPKNKPLFLNVAINKPPDTLENMVLLIDAEMEAGTNQPITIHSWDGEPIGTSS
jgi:hypothetical protein